MLGLIPVPALGASKPTAPNSVAPSNARVTEDGNSQIRLTETGSIRTTQ